MESLTWLKAGNKITVVLPNGQPKTVTEGDSNYEPVLQAIRDRNWEIIPDLLDPKAQIYNFSDGVFQVVDGTVHVEGKPVPDALSRKIISFSKENLPYMPLLNFWKKLNNNPSFHVKNSLFEFLDRNEYPITEDGDIIAYKGIKEDWTDCYTGKILNTVGKTVSMPRNEVNDNPNQKCSFGFHCANWEFSWGYGNKGHMIMISVNPENIVSMPNAYEFTKMRICEYTVIKEVFKEDKGKLYRTSIEEDNDCDGECDTCSCEE